MTFRLRRRLDTRTWFRRKTEGHQRHAPETSGNVLTDFLLICRLAWQQYRDAFTARNTG